MDEKELELLRAQAAQVAYTRVMLWAADMLTGALPANSGAGDTPQMAIIRAKLDAHLADMTLVTFPEIHWAESDQWAGELQEACERAANEFLARLIANGR